MTPELTALTLAALLQVAQFGLYSVAANLQVGTKSAMGTRDEVIELTGNAGRAKRALNNHFEGLILFSIACVVVTLAEKSGTLTSTCATLYLIARVAYVPAYLFGWVPWRSLIWAVGFVSTVFMLIAAVL